MQAKYRPKNLVLLAISIDADRKAFQAMVTRKQMNYPQIFDGERGKMAKLFNAIGTPTLYFIDPNGKIAGKTHSAKAVDEIISKWQP